MNWGGGLSSRPSQLGCRVRVAWSQLVRRTTRSVGLGTPCDNCPVPVHVSAIGVLTRFPEAVLRATLTGGSPQAPRRSLKRSQAVPQGPSPQRVHP